MVASLIKDDLTGRVARLAARGVVPGLGTVLVGDDGPSARYVAMKHADCAEVGIASAHVHLPADATQADVDAAVDRFNADPAVHAYLMQYPFPAPLDYDHPRGAQIALSLIRLPASDPAQRIGSLLINPGGPGGSA